MVTDPDDLTARLRALSNETVPAAVRAAHLKRLREELERQAPKPAPATWGTHRRLVLSAAVLVVLIGSAAVLIMADAAMPGDRLDGTKRAVEQVVGVVDSDIAAEHRVEEIGTLIHRRADPATISAAQARLAASIATLGDDHVLRQRERQLVLGPNTTDDPIDVAVDWAGGESFASSLPDGHLVFVDSQVGRDGSSRYDLTVTGAWHATARPGGWGLRPIRSDEAGGGGFTLVILVDADGVTVLIAADGESEGRDQDAPTPSTEPRSTFTSDRATGPSSSSTTAPTIATSTPTTRRPAEPTTTRPTTTTIATTTAPTTTKPPTTTTTTTRPTTTTTSGDDDDD